MVDSRFLVRGIRNCGDGQEDSAGLKMNEATIKILAILLIVFFGASVMLWLIEMIVHLIKAPRCPDCNDWLELLEGHVGVAYECPGCRGLFGNQEVEAHRERQSTRGG